MKLFFILFLSFVSHNASAGSFILAYGGAKFNLPLSPVAVGASPTIVVVKYSMLSGKRYISASTVEDDFYNGSCDYKDFFDSAMASPSNNLCGEEEIKSFQYVFMREAESGLWIKGGKYYYNFIREKGKEGRVFIVDDDKLTMIASDFLTKKEWKTIF